MPATMKFGLFSMNQGPCSRPEGAARIARLAEEAGFDSLWAGEHVVLPDPRVPPSPMDPGDPILDPVVALTFLAAHTSRVLLGTGIIILPQRNPLVLAKELASLATLSNGRFVFGIGVGYLEPEFRALGIPFDDKGPRTDEYLAAMRAIWTEAQPAYEGRFVRFSGVQAHPQPGAVPVVVGGHSPGAYRRAVEGANGWYGFGLDLERTANPSPGCARPPRATSAPPHSARWRSASRRAARSIATPPRASPSWASRASSCSHISALMKRRSSASWARSGTG